MSPRSAHGLAVACAAALLACQAIPPHALDPAREAAGLEGRSLESASLHAFAREILGESLPVAPQPWDERALVAAALYYQPRVAAAAASARQASAAIETARALPNPTLLVVPEYSLNPAHGESPWAPAVQIDWPIWTAGRGDRIDRVRAEALSAHYAFAAEIASIERDVLLARLELRAAEDAFGALEAEAVMQQELVGAWRRRVELGAVSRAEAAPAEASALEVRAELAAARTRRLAARAALAAAIGIPSARLAEVALAPAANAVPFAGIAADLVLRSALAERADVLAALAAYAATEAALQLEISRQFPDVRVGPGYQWDQEQNKWHLGISLDLPLLNQNQGPIAEALAAREVAAARFSAVQAGALAEVDAALATREGAAAERDALLQSAHELENLAERGARALAAGAANRVDAVGARALALRAQRVARDAELRWLGAELSLEAALQRARTDLDRLEQTAGRQEE